MFYKIVYQNGLQRLINLKNINRIDKNNYTISIYFNTSSGFGSWLFFWKNEKAVNICYNNSEDCDKTFNDIENFISNYKK